MKYPQKAIGTISASDQATSKSKYIIFAWFKATPTMRKTLLIQKHLVGLRVADHNSKKYITVYLPMLKTILDDDGDDDEEFVTRTTSDNAGKLHPVKWKLTKLSITLMNLVMSTPTWMINAKRSRIGQ
eukprot:5893168-Ditylum_brightwellii.AAC.1